MVRCPGCGSVVSPWAARCPVCRAGLETAVWVGPDPAVTPTSDPGVAERPPGEVGPAPAGSSGPEPGGGEPNPVAGPVDSLAGPHRGRRSRPHRRVLAAGLALVVVGAVVGVRLAGSGRSAEPPGTPSDRAAISRALNGLTAIATGRTGVQVVRLADADAVTVFRGASGPPLPTSGGIVFVHAGTAYLLAPPFAGPPRPLGSASRLFAITWPGLVGRTARAPDGRVEAVYGDLEVGRAGDSLGWELPPGFDPLGQYAAVGPGGVLRTWQPGPSRRAEVGVVFGHLAAVVAYGDSELAWLAAGPAGAGGSRGERPLHLSNIASLTEVIDQGVPPPPGHAGFLPGGALSPDGSALAAFVAGTGGQGELAVVDVRTRKVSVVPDSTIRVAGGVPSAAWSPDGSLLFFSGPGGKMKAYEPGGDVLTLTVGGFDSFAVQ